MEPRKQFVFKGSPKVGAKGIPWGEVRESVPLGNRWKTKEQGLRTGWLESERLYQTQGITKLQLELIDYFLNRIITK